MASLYLPDTSCLVAVVCQWHKHHEVTRQSMKKLRSSGYSIVVSAHSLLETFSVLTRLPAPYRLSEETAFKLLESNWSKTTAVSLSGEEYWKLIRSFTQIGISGGMAYDALIAACARKAKAGFVLTWNPQHFLRFKDQDLDIKTPS